ncbi:hypothetical protein ACYVVL_02160 [Escherichia coli]
MRMNVFEMEGFLRGKCVPRDLKVNETNAEYLVRKFDALEAKCAALENKIIPVSAELPPANESVLLFDANGEGWLIGWRSLWYTWGQKETGEWQWTFQVGDWICPYISRHLLSLNPLQARCRRYSRGER